MMMSAESWRSAIAMLMRLYGGFEVLGEVLRATDTDAYRVRFRHPDDPRNGYRVLEIEHRDLHTARDIAEYVCDVIDAFIARQHPPQPGRWSPYPWSPCA